MLIMDAVWAEDETTWLSQALITKCIASEEELWAKTSLPARCKTNSK